MFQKLCFIVSFILAISVPLSLSQVDEDTIDTFNTSLGVDFNDSLNELNFQPEERSFFILRNKQFYLGSPIKVNWYKAQELCAVEGNTLASVLSAQEAEDLRRFLVDNVINYGAAQFWLSGTQLAERGSWVWHSNGLPIYFTRWATGKPYSGGGYDCLAYNNDSTWTNVQCSQELYFICENRCQLDSYSVPLNK